MDFLTRALLPIGGPLKSFDNWQFSSLNDPNSQLATIRMEPGYADGVMVVIASTSGKTSFANEC